jgi:hypothetical protein
MTFKDLDHNEEYFPMVSRTGLDTFFGVPAAPLSPSTLDRGRPGVGEPSTHPVAMNGNPSPLPKVFYIEASGSRATGDSAEGGSDASWRDSPRNDSPSDSMSMDDNSITSSLPNTSLVALRNDEARWNTWNSQDLPRMAQDLFFASQIRPSCAVSIPQPE